MKPSTPDPLEIFAAAVREGAVWFDESVETMRAEIADAEAWRRLITAVGKHPEDVGATGAGDDGWLCEPASESVYSLTRLSMGLALQGQGNRIVHGSLTH